MTLNNKDHTHNDAPSSESPPHVIEYDFADRSYQRRTIARFVERERQDRVLWVNGSSGSGVTRVLNELIRPTEDIDVCYVDLPEHHAYEKLFEAVKERRITSFPEFMIERLKPSTAKARVATAMIAGVGTLCVAQPDPSLGAYAVTNALTAHSAASLIGDGMSMCQAGKRSRNTDFVEMKRPLVRGSKKNTVLVLDNFSRCSEEDADKICDLILLLLDQKPYGFLNRHLSRSSVYCVVATMQEDLARKPYLRSMIAKQFRAIPLCVKPLINPDHFTHMLSNAFDLTGKGEMIEYLFRICEGNPGRLDEIVSEIFCMHPEVLAHGFTMNHVWEAQRCREARATFDFDAFRFPAGLILRCLAASNIPWPVSLLTEAAASYGRKSNSLNPVTRKHIDNAIKLLDRHCRVICPDTVDLLELRDPSFASDSIAASGKAAQNAFDQWLREFMSKRCADFLAAGVSQLSVQRAVSDCSVRGCFYSKASDAFGYSITCLQQGRLNEAASGFRRIEPDDPFLSIQHRIVIAGVLYDAGCYDEALRYLEDCKKFLTSMQNERGSDIVSYLCLLSEVESILLTSKDKALGHIEQAMRHASSDPEKFHILSVKQKILTNLEANRSSAKSIFDEAKAACPQSCENSLPYARLLSTSAEFYRGGQAQHDLNKAMEIALEHHDIALQGSIRTNQGFDHFWQGHLKTAAKLSIEAIRLLAQCRPHEISYPLNNLANCQIMMGKFEKALNTIERALLWNRSSYLSFTLRNAQMVASALATDSERPFFLAKNLLEKMKAVDHLDMSIRINTLYNIEKVYQWADRVPPFERGSALNLAHKQSAEDLPYLWLEGFRDDIEADMQERLKGQELTLFRAYRFEPWLVSLTHDRQLGALATS